jgi:hypothetical protein
MSTHLGGSFDCIFILFQNIWVFKKWYNFIGLKKLFKENFRSYKGDFKGFEKLLESFH